MSQLVAGFGLLGIACAWLVLPLLPTLKELHQRTDNQPFQIIQENPFNPFHFADAFATRLEYLRDEIDRCRIHGESGTRYFENGQACRIVAHLNETSGVAEATYGQSVLVICTPANLPGHYQFTNELYVTDDLSCGEETIFSAILSDGAVEFGPRTNVLRWAHSRSHLRVGEGSVLRGRLTSEQALHLGCHTTFERLHAPCIHFGTIPAGYTISPPYARQQQAHVNGTASRQRTVVPGNLLMTADRIWSGNFVVKGRVTVAEGCSVEGSLKSYGDMQIGAGAVITGAVVSQGNIELGRESVVLGPVISERTVVLGSGCQVGTAEQPATVTAPNIEAAVGALVFGTAWAREHGYVEN